MGPWAAAASAGFLSRWLDRAAPVHGGLARQLVTAASASASAASTALTSAALTSTALTSSALTSSALCSATFASKALVTVALASTIVAAAEMAVAGAPASPKTPAVQRQANGVPAQQRRTLRVTFLGDSITAAGDWQRRFPDALITNAGRSGDTTLDLLARLGPVRDGRPQLVLLMVGINDLLRGGREQAVAERIALIRRLLAEQGQVRVIQQSTLSCEASRCGAAMVARVRRLNRDLRAGVAEDDFLDVDAVLSDATGLRPKYSLDGLHLTPAAYSRWQELLRARLGRQLGRSSALP